jgi:hypothetical protein
VVSTASRRGEYKHQHNGAVSSDARSTPDLTEIHHSGFGEIAEHRAQRVLSLLARRISPKAPSRISPAARASWRASCPTPATASRLDISGGMLRCATEHAPSVTFHHVCTTDNFYRRTDERHVLRLYKRNDAAELVQRSGFTVEFLASYQLGQTPTINPLAG